MSGLPPDPCHWVEDPGVPGGRYLVPGCWSRVHGGEDAECQCDDWQGEGALSAALAAEEAGS
jgi:hypothetical protein